MKKTLTIHDFPVTYRWDDESGWYQSGVPYEICEKIMGKMMWKRFCKWHFGSTSGQDGIYPWDIKDFLKNKPNLD